MTIEEKLRIFYDTTIADATKQSEVIITEYKASLKNIYDEHKKEAGEKATFTLDVECQKLVQEKNKDLSLQSLEFKRQINEKAEALKSLLFEDVEKRLLAFMTTKEYTALLVSQINAANKFSSEDEMTIYINHSDADKKAFLEKATGSSITISTIDFMGGTRAVIHSKNILIDRSFLTKFSEEKDMFTL
ncbi:MAG: V-type ATP synthase subunit E [Velocimicrobium sp.]